MFNQTEEASIRAWNDGLDGHVTLHVLLSDDTRSERVEAFARQFAALAPRVGLAIDRRPGAEAPSMHVSRRVRYLAVPVGTELAPFLECVRRLSPCVTDASRSALAREPGSGDADVHLYVSPHCPHCPVATRALFGLLDENPAARLVVVDVDLLPEMATRDAVRSVPTVLVGRHYRSTGAISVDEIRRALASTEPDAAAIGRLLDGGEAAAVADMMAEAGRVFSTVLDRVAHETMTVRLGAMAALERLIEIAPEVAATAESGLWERIAGTGREATGDVLYMLGEAGTPATVPWLRAFHEATADPELQEAVTDALARLAERAER